MSYSSTEWRLRPVAAEDLAQLYELAQRAPTGLTTLPPNKKLLAQKVENSLRSFNEGITTPQSHYYFFVLEKFPKILAGTSAIEACVGLTTPFYSYRLSRITRACYPLNIRNSYQVLHLNNDLELTTELCTLYLNSEYRGGGLGKLLSLGRLLFMAQFPERFNERVIAELRGMLDQNGDSPFWEGLGRKFFNMDFATADRLTIQTNKQFISDLMPRHPIYINLLNKEAAAAIAKPNPTTIPAMRLLEHQGLSWDGYIDIFDGGPTIMSFFKYIHTIRHNKIGQIKKILQGKKSLNKENFLYLVSNNQLSFRAIQAPLTISDTEVEINENDAKLLEVEVGDAVRFISST